MPYPISEKTGRVLEGHAVTKPGKWWEAVVLLESPIGKKKIGIFKWENVGGTTTQTANWKRRQYLYINKEEHFKAVLKGLKDMGAELGWDA